MRKFVLKVTIAVALSLPVGSFVYAAPPHPNASVSAHDKALIDRMWQENLDKVIGTYSMADLEENPLHTEQRYLAMKPVGLKLQALAVNTVPIPLRNSASLLSDTTMIRPGFYMFVDSVDERGFATVHFLAGPKNYTDSRTGYVAAAALKNADFPQ